MATAKKLPSGNWRVRVYDKTSGKTKSFTASTKKGAELQAARWLNDLIPKPLNEKKLSECIDDYIKIKENVLSPTTIDKYRNIKKNQLTPAFLNLQLNKLNSAIIQDELNDLAGRYSAKTVHNASGLISAVLGVYYPDFRYKVTLPQVQKKKKDYPSAVQIVDMFKGTNIELPVLLGLWLGLRLSEIRGLQKTDIKNGILSINRVKVDIGTQTITKDNAKTANSKRDIKVPSHILSLIESLPTDNITDLNHRQIYQRFKRIVTKYGFPDMTFHDLRHLNASIMLLLGVPDKYAMERGGWSTSSTLKKVYQETFSDERKKVDSKVDEYFSKILATKLATQKPKRRIFKLKKLNNSGSNPQ